MAENAKQLAIANITKFANSDHYQSLFKNALGKKAGQFTTSIIELTTNDTQLQQCDQKLVLAEAAKAATLDLPISKSIGFAYVVTFKNKGVPTPTLIISARGWQQLAIRSGQYKYINSDVVYEGEFQSKDKLTGAIDLSGTKTSNKVVGFFAYFQFNNGFSKTLYMSVEDMCHYAKTYSPTLKFNKSITEESLAKLIQKVADEGPIAGGQAGWLSDPVSMALKTVLKRLLYKHGYVSIEMAHAMEDDETPSETPDVTTDKEVVDVTDSVEEVVNEETDEISTQETTDEEPPC